MIKRIANVDKSASDRTYATDIKGNPMFGRTPAITAMLKVGAYVYVDQETQTKTKNANGELVDIPIEEQRKLWIVKSVFATKDEALNANAEEQLLEAETEFLVNTQRAKFAEVRASGTLAGAVS